MKSNIFEVANARDMDSLQIADEFIWTSTFDRLFSNKNHIILGARGSGKTALIKMLAFDGLSNVTNETAKKYVADKTFIGTFLPLRAEFTTKLKLIDNNTSMQDYFFIWSMNLASCNQFLNTARHCINKYSLGSIEQIRTESNLSEKLGIAWFDKKFNSLKEISLHLSNIEYEKNYTFNKVTFGFQLESTDFDIGKKFHADLFTPFKKAIDALKECINFKENTIWSLCIDEAEILTDSQWVLLNTQMRTYSDIVFKITTMPYKHKSLDTLTEQKLNVKHDFEYIYLDRLGTLDKPQKEADQIIQKFAIQLFSNKIKNSSYKNQGISLNSLLGKSDLTDNSANILSADKLMVLIRKYCTEKTVTRAELLFERNRKGKFSDQIERPLRPLLILKDYLESTTGQGFSSPQIYSGVDIAIKCCDGNPRKLINLFNRLISTSTNSDLGFRPLSQSQQGRILKNFSVSELESIKVEDNGYKASQLLVSIGNYFKTALHNNKIGIHINMAFEFDTGDSSTWAHIMNAVDLGLLIPEINAGLDKDSMPVMSGKFQIAGCLAPYFFLLPRKGEPLLLSTIISRISSSSMRPLSTNTSEQLGLFDE
jgi:hypothetical protein